MYRKPTKDNARTSQSAHGAQHSTAGRVCTDSSLKINTDLTGGLNTQAGEELDCERHLEGSSSAGVTSVFQSRGGPPRLKEHCASVG